MHKLKNQTQTLRVEKHSSNSIDTYTDVLAIEEPLEIRLDYVPDVGLGQREPIRKQKSVSITMRTPGSDRELAVGFLFTEGLIQTRTDVLDVQHCGPIQVALGHSNIMKVTLAPSIHIASRLSTLDRNFYTTSSCGVCGKSSIDALRTQSVFKNFESRGPFVSTHDLVRLPNELRKAQAVFASTGGLHASGLFHQDGSLLDLREDVGRHNALDKIIGHAFLNEQLPLSESVLMLSGRISFELVQKASMAGLKFIAAVGAPSSLAVDLAKESDITLIGFLRGETFNVYCGRERLT